MAMTFLKANALGLKAAALGGVALLGACTTASTGDGAPRMSGISVTRFHLGGEIAKGEVAVEPRFEVQAAGGVYEPGFGAIVANELRPLGFVPSGAAAASEYIATVDVATATVSALAARTPGAAVAAGPPVNPNAVATQLAVQLKRRSDGSIVWQGRAQAAARASAVASRATVQKLARALFRDFPGETGRTINIR